MPQPAVARAVDARLPPEHETTGAAAFWARCIPGLLKALDSAQLLSLDVFDTLLLRTTAHPHDVFLEVGRRAARRGWIARHIAPEHFRAIRVNAERRARAARNGGGPAEVTLEEIWSSMPSLVLCDPRDGAALEVEVEADTCYVNPVVWSLVDAARARGISVALVSDMYVSPAQLRTIVERAGCPLDRFVAVLVSSERRGAKWDGTMFARLANRFPGIPRDAMLHVGDNRASDVDRAREAGLTAYHYDPKSAMADDVEPLERALHGAVAGELSALRRLAARTAMVQPEGLRWWHEFGAVVLGPFLSAFADWVVDECVEDGVTTVRPLLREGALLSDLIGASALARGAALDIEPLHVSRAATFLPGLDAIDGAVIDDLCSRPHLTQGQVLALLGLNPPAEPQNLQEYLRQPSVFETIEQHRRDARERFVRFLSTSVSRSPDVMLVDVGFHGTMGLAIERATRGRLATRWHQLLAVGAESIERAWTDGADVRAFTGGPAAHLDTAPELIRHAAVLEAVLVSGPSTCGYIEEDGRVRPRTEPARHTAEQAAALAACRDGIVAFQRVWLSLRGSSPEVVSRLVGDRHVLLRQLHRFVRLPTAAEAAHVGGLWHEHNGGSTSQDRLCDVSAIPHDLDATAFLAAAGGGASAYGRTWLWPPGVVTQRWPGYLAAHYGVAQSANEIPALAALAQRVQGAGVARCLVYGAGDAGRALAASLRARGVTVAGFVDRSERLRGTFVEGLPVLAPSDAVAGECHTYAVGSLAFATQIADDLGRLYADRPGQLQLFAPAPEAAS